MRELEALAGLGSNVRLFVPSTLDIDQKAVNSSEVRMVAELFSSWFGGATAYRALGCWSSPAVGLVSEEVTIIESFCSESALASRISEVIDFARALRDRLRQEAVVLEVDRKLYLI